MNKARKHIGVLISSIKECIPEKTKDNISKRMGLAAQIDDALKNRGFTNQEFAFMMGKKPSEISRWLSGTHNFTTETLWEIERVLSIQLLTSSKPYEVQETDLKAYIVCEVEKAFEKYSKKK
ncbi:MAG: helix-turn-helix domain-containing protein [Leadbetterella sp.]|nr:helix-turn-helix domain-containing protein [Leadbetterella sp.]